MKRIVTKLSQALMTGLLIFVLAGCSAFAPVYDNGSQLRLRPVEANEFMLLTAASWTTFCLKYPNFARCGTDSTIHPPSVRMADWANKIADITWQAKKTIRYEQDIVVWQREEHWDFPRLINNVYYEDCDGIMIWIIQKLVDAGFPAENIYPTAVLTADMARSLPSTAPEGIQFKNVANHAVVVVETVEGFYAIDLPEEYPRALENGWFSGMQNWTLLVGPIQYRAVFK